MQILHISGAQCSGKTYISKPYHNHPDVAFWDILALYEREKCIVNDKMDWDKWEKVKPMIIPELEQFLKDNEDKKVCIVESGTNQTISAFLQKKNHVIDIQLKTPSVEVTTERAKERGLSVERVLDFRDTFLKRHVHNDRNQYTQEEAALILKAYIEGEIRVAIIGTAGRKTDATKMSKALYFKMCKQALTILERLQIWTEGIHLISGGAAWADHVAVSIYLSGKAWKLTLYVPAEFNNDQFYGSADARTANYYHEKFTAQMGGDTRNGITRAISRGAVVNTIEGFKNRNLEVAKCDLMIAFTWGDSKDCPKDGGTKHTWSHSAAPVKIHVPLKELQKDN